MDIILHPNSEKKSLKDYYKKAFKEGNEILIVTAYLTNWDIDLPLNNNCEAFSLIIGTDFGITKKQACYKVLKWLPKYFKSDFCAADFTNGFHPKVIIWRKNNEDYYAIIGSSNLTQAAFDTNYEVNVFLKIDEIEYRRLKKWIHEIKRLSSPISNDWIAGYNEIKRNYKGKHSVPPRIITFNLPKGKSIVESIKSRRKQQKSFSLIKSRLLSLIKKCASNKISNLDFYYKLMNIWGYHKSRFQGQGFQIKGKNGNWQVVCNSLYKILTVHQDISIAERDNLVKREIDFLAKKNNPTRGAWLTEILCHYYPDFYPLVNKPIETWLRFNKFRSPRKSSEGSKYIDLSLKLRQAISEYKNYPAKNLAELDGAIWKWYDNNYK
ncbi:MAG: phospholipase D family protein [Ignavibacteriales bacterium]|nr:MAG: phospholipase D family protein [Ignavibacteriales bacterium]